MKLKFTFLGLFFFVLFQANDFFKSVQSKSVKNASSLVIFYRPDCPYCMKLNNEIENNADLSKQIKTKFNVSAIDITTAEGRQIAAFYGVDKVPTIIKYDNKNEQFENIVGFQKSDALRKLLFHKNSSQKALKNLNTASICGDGIVESPEACDDGNMANGDGCSNMCTVESGWSCSGTTSICTPIAVCGNGIVESGEACDDGNMSNGDGCNNTCTVQSGWSCTGSPSVCSNTLSVGEVSNQGVFNINVAPNPVTDKLHIQFFLSNKSNAEIVILDVSGKKVFQTKNNNLIVGSNDLEIVLKDKLFPGIYLLKMKFSNDKVVTKKIMIK
jgi:cysteine-rich repeat protein